jgi:hypothetical protein
MRDFLQQDAERPSRHSHAERGNDKKTLKEGRNKAIHSVNYTLIMTNWHIGKYIVEFEQEGNVRATYGTALLDNLSRDLTKRYGKGFSRSNLNFIRMFYVKYPNCETLSHKFSSYFKVFCAN